MPIDQLMRAPARPATPEPSLESVGQFSIGIAHDFNNVLTGILANGRLLASSYADAEAAPAELRELIAAAEQGAQMVRRLISFARHEPLQRKLVNLHELVAVLPGRLRSSLQATHRLKVDADSGPLLVLADSSVLEEIVHNLVTNARDAMPAGGTLRISVRRVLRDAGGVDAAGTPIPAGAYVTITVRDTGTGLDDATRTYMFEPFFTTKPRGRGAGLGLAMCRTLTRQLDGFIEVASTAGIGTSVIVSLPQAPVSMLLAESRVDHP
ncbi:MAG: hypothetical protein IT355_08345 [Gemmatimonadaceae bacterium]|nr:hypothetical protein [Gemmatimonadaceae bacterium]